MKYFYNPLAVPGIDPDRIAELMVALMPEENTNYSEIFKARQILLNKNALLHKESLKHEFC